MGACFAAGAERSCAVSVVLPEGSGYNPRNMPPLTYVAVATTALRHNLAQVRALLEPATRVMAVVKANAYGHGLVLAAQAFVEGGADWLGVSTLEEGVALREAGVQAPVLVFLPGLPEQAGEFLARGLSATVVGETGLVALARAAETAGRTAHFHFYRDGGLGRPGVDDLPRLVELASGFPGLELDGVYLHMDATAELNLGGLEALRPGSEFRLFAAGVREITTRLLGAPAPVHCAASALTLRRPEARLDLVRLGTLLYGQYPVSVPAALRALDLRPTLALRSTVVAVEALPRGATVGYGAQYRCSRETRVGLLPVGYAAGLGTMPVDLARRRYASGRGLARRLLRGEEKPAATVAGRPAPLLGRIAMDWCCVDLTDLPEAEVGTEVTLPARQALLDAGLARVEVERLT
jgi:alanine racemase